MTKSLNITEARNKLTSLPDELARDHGSLTVTRRGKPVLAIMDWDMFEALTETLEIMSDPEMLAVFRKGVADMDKGRVHDWEEVKAGLDL